MNRFLFFGVVDSFIHLGQGRFCSCGIRRSTARLSDLAVLGAFLALLEVGKPAGLCAIGQLELGAAAIAEGIFEAGLFEQFFAAGALGLEEGVELGDVLEDQGAAGTLGDILDTAPRAGEGAVGVANAAVGALSGQQIDGLAGSWRFLARSPSPNKAMRYVLSPTLTTPGAAQRG
ncbi:MAG: hypothetical protein HC888_12545 [Candidatus Competibacteraceae bacterium]|nr:hypothetical protein [Candidatus Competibacteraceae bacterium]